MNSRKPSIAVIGAGILGRLVSYFLIEDDHPVTLFEKNGSLPTPDKSCSLTAAGMLAPFCELEYSDPKITKMGLESIEIWKSLHKRFNKKFLFEQNGSLVVTHPRDQRELLKLKEVIKRNFPGEEIYSEESSSDLEPDIKNLGQGLYFRSEGHVDPYSFFEIYNESYLDKFKNVFFNTEVINISPGIVQTGKGDFKFDMVIDCRGFAAKADLKNLRGVRGELFLIETKEVKLKRFVRLMHPRYPLYIVPKPNNQFIVGATSIESEDISPVSVRSGLELFSAIYSLNPAFGEARIIEQRVHLRPAFADNLPRIEYQKGLIRANGLYRHGFLASPKLAQMVFKIVKEKEFGSYVQELR